MPCERCYLFALTGCITKLCKAAATLTRKINIFREWLALRDEYLLTSKSAPPLFRYIYIVVQSYQQGVIYFLISDSFILLFYLAITFSFERNWKGFQWTRSIILEGEEVLEEEGRASTRDDNRAEGANGIKPAISLLSWLISCVVLPPPPFLMRDEEGKRDDKSCTLRAHTTCARSQLYIGQP